jgi:hypothetical protein
MPCLVSLAQMAALTTPSLISWAGEARPRWLVPLIML